MSSTQTTNWHGREFASDHILPSAGEIIRLETPVAKSGWNHGPCSIPATSVPPSVASNPKTRNRPNRVTVPRFHHAVVIAADKLADGSIDITYYSIMSYQTSKPKNWIGTWVPCNWYQQATYEERLFNIPVPTHDNNLQPPTEFGEPLDCGWWKNDHYAWIAMEQKDLTLAPTKEWKQHEPRILLADKELARLLIHETSIARHLRHREHAIQVAAVGLPDYDNVWGGNFGAHRWAHGTAAKVAAYDDCDDCSDEDASDSYTDSNEGNPGDAEDDGSDDFDEIEWIRIICRACKIDAWSLEGATGEGDAFLTEQPCNADGNMLSQLDELEMGEDYQGVSDTS
ncbi:hypothetical protein K440DRAFT_644069 [Wilcoxina mikolae CBS 423.85]|nr:hypothetical protein K440DRAFT_644069 [Wilcoxina mikolae CBS 423.85]